MPRYDYYCPECGSTKEVVKTMAESSDSVFCDRCCFVHMDRDFQAEGVRSRSK